MSGREPEVHLLKEDDVKRGLRHLPEERAPVTVVAADHPVPVREPGRCQACHAFALLERHWPGGILLPGRHVEICAACRELGDAEIMRRLPDWRRDGAST